MGQQCNTWGDCMCVDESHVTPGSSINSANNDQQIDDSGILIIVLGAVAGVLALVCVFYLYMKHKNLSILGQFSAIDPYESVSLEDVPVAEALEADDDLEVDDDHEVDENANLVPN